MEIKGYKVFNSDWTCRGKQYTCPGRFQEPGALKLCGHGMHFCLSPIDCFRYYPFSPENHVAEVIACGKIKMGLDKCCTDCLEIVREVPWEEVLSLVNTGKDNNGVGNTGNNNKGHQNSGKYNDGDSNVGSFNVGSNNTGSHNTGGNNVGTFNFGNFNTGSFNCGSRNAGSKNWGTNNAGSGNIGILNSGDFNLGNYNTGDWNKTNFSAGYFCTEEPKLMFFNKPSDWTRRDWLFSQARTILYQLADWMSWSEMSEEEKHTDPHCEKTGGCPRTFKPEHNQEWWDNLPPSHKAEIMAIPNFDKNIFEEITSIKV